jgi:hypothetical protein
MPQNPLHESPCSTIYTIVQEEFFSCPVVFVVRLSDGAHRRTQKDTERPGCVFESFRTRRERFFQIYWWRGGGGGRFCPLIHKDIHKAYTLISKFFAFPRCNRPPWSFWYLSLVALLLR